MMDQRRGRQRTARQLVYGTLATASRGTQDHVGEREGERERVHGKGRNTTGMPLAMLRVAGIAEA